MALELGDELGSVFSSRDETVFVFVVSPRVHLDRLERRRLGAAWAARREPPRVPHAHDAVPPRAQQRVLPPIRAPSARKSAAAPLDEVRGRAPVRVLESAALGALGPRVHHRHATVVPARREHGA